MASYTLIRKIIEYAATINETCKFHKLTAGHPKMKRTISPLGMRPIITKECERRLFGNKVIIVAGPCESSNLGSRRCILKPFSLLCSHRRDFIAAKLKTSLFMLINLSSFLIVPIEMIKICLH